MTTEIGDISSERRTPNAHKALEAIAFASGFPVNEPTDWILGAHILLGLILANPEFAGCLASRLAKDLVAVGVPIPLRELGDEFLTSLLEVWKP